MSLTEKMAAQVASFKERNDVLAEALAYHEERIEAAVEAHTLQYLQNRLLAGGDPDEAVLAAHDEAERHRLHLAKTVMNLADTNVKNETLFCANCNKDTEHALTVDGNGETVATCACGRFKKIPVEPVVERRASKGKV